MGVLGFLIRSISYALANERTTRSTTAARITYYLGAEPSEGPAIPSSGREKESYMSARTFKLQTPLMEGSDIEAWQKEMKNDLFHRLKIENVPIDVDGVYGHGTRSITADLCKAYGIDAGKELKKGVTPTLRKRIRNGDLTDEERKRRDSSTAKRFRSKLRDKWATKNVASPLHRIISDSWGYHPGVHDGEDLICDPDAVIFAMCDAEVVDVRASGWWGLGAPSDPNLKAKGDGIIQIKVLENVGPLKAGMHLGYGHAEKAVVKVGQRVKAGQMLGHAGFANAWHVHFMVNHGEFGTQGRGSQDPRPIVDYCVKNG
jgi:murein DD-endopeptidase MepM/ murein hydrolase activator NlpD